MNTRQIAAVIATACCTAGIASGQDWYREGPTSAPPARRFHGLGYDDARGVTVLFGGVDERGDVVHGDTWEYDGSDWALCATGGPSPRQRFATCMDPEHGLFLVFGGEDAHGVLLDDTWAWDGTSWFEVPATLRPPARADSTMWFDDSQRRLVMFGGRAAAGNPPFGDTWEYDGRNWVQLAPTRSPAPRFGHAAVFDPLRRVAVVHGGFVNGAQATSTDTWEFDGTDWLEVATANPPAAMIFPSLTFHRAHGVAVLTGGTGILSQALRTFALDGGGWQPGPLAPSGLPGVQGHDTAYDAQRDAVVLFGGATISLAGARPRDETWELSVEAAFDRFGHGCATPVGMPALATVDGRRPELGRALVLEVAPVPASAPTLLLIGLDDQHWGGVSLPFDLDAVGMPGCGLFVAIDAVEPMTVTSGAARRTLQVPLDRGLLGESVFVQAFVAGGATSDAGRLLIGN